MDSSIRFSLFIIAVMVASAAAASSPGLDFITSSCKATGYPTVCVSSLSPYGASLKGKPSKREVVRAALQASLQDVHNLADWTDNLAKTGKGLDNSERTALQGCVYNLDDSSEQIKESLNELSHLTREMFDEEMKNMITWMSAALTDEDSCLNGFEGVRNGNVKRLVNGRVLQSSKVVSNALALVNDYAKSGGN